MRVINWELLANPFNWLIVFLMIGIFGVAIHFISVGGVFKHGS